MKHHSRSIPRRFAYSLTMALTIACASSGMAHPLGNFTISHFTRIAVGANRIAVRYVVDFAEIPAYQELQAIDSDRDGSASAGELATYADTAAVRLADGLVLRVDGDRLPLSVVERDISTPSGSGGLPTLRIECDFAAAVPASGSTERRLRFEDNNHRGRLGWREIVVTLQPGVAVLNSNAYGSSFTDEIKAYPEDSLAAPLDEREADLVFTLGQAPAQALGLLTRDGRPVVESRDRLSELIAVPELTIGVALLGLLLAAALGVLHALSPGHGKTVVGAYLVGSRGTARHAAFLGLTVTVTHTVGVFALGVVTLFASQYVVPERLFPVLSLISGMIVLGIGGGLFIRRLRSMLPQRIHPHDDHSHPLTDSHTYEPHQHQQHDHRGGHLHDHNHDHERLHLHSHGGREHSHLPAGADGSRVTWRSLLALGVSGGLLPCPSALVVLLSAISLQRVGYGLLLVLAFSVGLAATLTAVGLMFVYAGRLMKQRVGSARLVRALPVVSALVISVAGAAICYGALKSVGVHFAGLLTWLGGLVSESSVEAGKVSTGSLLLLGLLFGLKHAVEADHLAAVSTIVSERKSILSSSLVGALWGIGHTAALLIAGIAVLLLHVSIGARTAQWLELGVAVMLIALGGSAVSKLIRGGRLHIHPHSHGPRAHVHPHRHDRAPDAEGSHHRLRLGLRLTARPLIVGMMHGVAGSAALMLLVLSAISSPAVGFAYIGVFGLGSVGGMFLMSALVSLPVHLTASRFVGVNNGLRLVAGVFSLSFGLYMLYEIGVVNGLFM